MSEKRSIIYIGLVSNLLFSSDFNETWVFSTDFPRILKYQISWKTVKWEPNCCTRKEGQTDRHEEFYVLLTVHLDIILFNEQLDAQFIFVYVYFKPLHVSSIQVLIIRRFNRINTISGICHSDRLVCRFGRNVQTYIPDGQSDIYQISYWYGWISWWWALEWSKHVEVWNKHIQKRTVRQFGH